MNSCKDSLTQKVIRFLNVECMSSHNSIQHQNILLKKKLHGKITFEISTNKENLDFSTTNLLNKYYITTAQYLFQMFDSKNEVYTQVATAWDWNTSENFLHG